MDGSKISFLEFTRNLGLTVDTDLRFSRHISNCLLKAYASLRNLYQFRSILSKSSKILLCESTVLSYMNYCDAVYGPCLTAFDKNRIQVLQNSCLRLIHGLRKYDSVSYTLKTTGWLSMELRRRFHSYVLFYRIITEKLPINLYNRITFRSAVHSINIRSKRTISIPKHRTDIFTRSYSYQVPNCMNSLDFEYRNITLDKFKLHIMNNFRNDPLYA